MTIAPDQWLEALRSRSDPIFCDLKRRLLCTGSLVPGLKDQQQLHVEKEDELCRAICTIFDSDSESEEDSCFKQAAKKRRCSQVGLFTVPWAEILVHIWVPTTTPSSDKKWRHCAAQLRSCNASLVQAFVDPCGMTNIPLSWEKALGPDLRPEYAGFRASSCWARGV